MPLPFVFVGGSLIRNLKFSQLSSRTEGGRGRQDPLVGLCVLPAQDSYSIAFRGG